MSGAFAWGVVAASSLLGAVLTMLADTMMPEAFKYGGKTVGLLTTFGFAVSVAIVALEQ